MTVRKIAFATVLVAATLIAAHGAIAQRPDQPTQSDRPGEVQGMSRERLARIERVMKEQIGKGIFPGAVTLVARRGQVVHFEAYGFLDSAKMKP